MDYGNQKIIVSFRPSSHSYDATIVIQFKTEEEARQAAQKANNGPGYRSGSSYGNLALISFSDGSWDEPDETLAEVGEGEKVNEYGCYQEITVKITLPAGSSIETAALLEPAQAGLLRWLLNKCKPIKVKNTKEVKMFTFSYKGESIYDRDINGKHAFYIDQKTIYVEKTNVEVIVHI